MLKIIIQALLQMSPSKEPSAQAAICSSTLTVLAYFFRSDKYKSLSAIACLLVLMLFSSGTSYAQTPTTFPTGAFIVNMGVTPQTFNNGLKPYGMVYDLVKNYGVPVKWIINGSKTKDGTDFTYNSVAYKGGPFIIPAAYRSSAVNARITYWQGQGVVGITTTSPLVDAPVMVTLKAMPSWTLDAQNGGIAQGYIANAGIPATAYNYKDPQALTCCDDIFAMPHADPKWSTHSNLYGWNRDCDGAIWLACHAGSALELMFNPSNKSQQTNFLSKKTGIAQGGGPYADPSNSLIHWGDHDDGTLPYSYNYPSDPFMQFIGSIDAATQNGSEQIYIPVAGGGWNPGAKMYVYDPNHPEQVSDPAAIVVSGRGLDSLNRGRVMLEAAHSHNKGSKPENVAAQRIFFNFSFFTANEKAIIPDISALPSSLNSGVPTTITFTLPPGVDSSVYNVVWASSCGGTFTPNNTTKTVIYTPPVVASSTVCFLSVQITDPCGRVFKDTKEILVACNLSITRTLTSPSCFGQADGSIAMAITGGAGPYNWNWTRTGGGSNSGAGTTISGLIAGTYNVTVTANGGTGCSGTFTANLTQAPLLDGSATKTDVLCNGSSTGAIDLTVTGGTPSYTYLWTGGATTEDRSNIPAGPYSVTITDTKGCKDTVAITVNQPSPILITPTPTHVLCHGDNTGAISLAVSGGTPNYTYAWGDGATTKDRINLTQGSYTVTVTDANGCTAISSGINITQPTGPLALSAMMSNVSCNGANDGWIKVTPTGGTTDYNFLWSNAATADSIGGLSGGTYTVTVTDMNNCTAVLTKEITEAPALNLSLVVNNASCPGDTDGSIILTVTGGTPTPTYDWSNDGPDTPDDDPKDLNNVAAGTYSVTVTDANACTAVASGTIINTSSTPAKPSTIKH